MCVMIAATATGGRDFRVIVKPKNRRVMQTRTAYKKHAVGKQRCAKCESLQHKESLTGRMRLSTSTGDSVFIGEPFMSTVLGQIRIINRTHFASAGRLHVHVWCKLSIP